MSEQERTRIVWQWGRYTLLKKLKKTCYHTVCGTEMYWREDTVAWYCPKCDVNTNMTEFVYTD